MEEGSTHVIVGRHGSYRAAFRGGVYAALVIVAAQEGGRDIGRRSFQGDPPKDIGALVAVRYTLRGRKVICRAH